MKITSSRICLAGFFIVLASCGGGSGGGSSSPPPAAVSLVSVSPNSATAGSQAVEVTAEGSGFTASSVVEWNGVALTTSYVSSTSLTATVPTSDLATAGSAAVTVSDAASGGTSSGIVNFTINTQTAPSISGLAPSKVAAGGAAFQLVITGTNFRASASVLWNGRAVPTTFDSAAQLTAQITAAQIATVATVPVTVVNDAAEGGTSNASQFTITAEPPVPTLTTLSPTSIPAYAGPATLTLTGTNFTPTTQLAINGSIYQPTYVSTTQLRFANFSTYSPAGSQITLTVQDPASGDVSSNALILKITQPVPVISAIAPAAVTVGQGSLPLTVTGLYFTSTSVVYFNGSATPTTLNNQGQLVAQLTALDFTGVGTATITVEDPASGNVASNAVNLPIQALPPLTLATLSPATVPAGNVAFTLTLLGNGFTANSIVAWNGANLPTTYVSVTTLRASVTATQVASTGSITVTVVNPANQGGTSGPLTLTIVPPSVDAVSYQINNGHNGSITFKSATLPAAASWSVNLGGPASYALIVSQRVYVIAYINNNSELFALDASTGATIWGPIEFAGGAGLTYDGGTLFVNSGSFAAAGILSALNASTGAPLWSATIPGEFASSDPPVAAEGSVYTLEDSEVTSFNELTGAQQWSVSDFSGTNGSLALTVDGVYTSGPCTAFDAQPTTGAVIWTNNTGCEGGGGATPVVGSGVLFAPIDVATYGGNIYAADTGTLLGGFSYSTLPAVSATSIYALTNSTLQGITLSNNQVNWSFAGDGTLTTAPIVVNGFVFVGSSSGNLYALDATTGAQLWSKSLGAAIAPSSQIQSGLSAGDGLLIVPSGNSVTAYVLSTNP